MLIGFEYLFAIDLKAKMVYFYVSILINTFEKVYLVCLSYMQYILILTLCYSLGAKRNVKAAGNYVKKIKLFLINSS